ncbi:MAG: excinuclease ABC subunit UvrC [Flavobacteriales bacterium]|nr:excinuclease ABC subunit UvrC [Flavobacteriales bacterium]MBL6872471.1 excinuclease ABC subunit UvrC [Flavobacteriales bacterium]
MQSVLLNLTTEAGVYRFYDKEDGLLYIGKAKNLKRRVSSYFNREHNSFKTTYMVRKIDRIEILVVETEMDALLLENNLIKKYQPRYNILLKDDKTYPWICIKKEPFPRVFYTRTLIKDGSEYFGPYTNPKLVNTMLSFIRQIYPLRTCKFNLSKDNIEANKFKECLEFHIGNCLAPCVGKQKASDYEKDITQIRQILKGNIRTVVQHFKDEMFNFSEKMEYEKAQLVKEKIEQLEHYQSKSSIVSPSINDVDVFCIASDKDYAYVNFFKVSSGAIIQAHAMEIKKKLDESDEELLTMAITEIRQRFHSTSKEAFLNIPLESSWENLKVSVPKIGDKYKLVMLCYRNAKNLQKDRIRKNDELRHRLDNRRVLEQLQSDLRLKQKPRHIECFDNSNIQGTNPVAACVVFRNAKPSKKEYRHFNIKTVEGPDDFASMEEVVFRRYKRLKEEGQDLPQLIVIDGGKGQLSSARKSLEKLGLEHTIAIIGIAKRLEEIYFPGDSIPIYLDKRSESLKVIQQLRNEAHRFGINHHRNRRSKNSLGTSLDGIQGIGPKTVDKLISHFGSVKRVMEASEKELSKLVGKSKAKLILRK